MVPADNFKTFKEVLDDWQSLQSLQINIIVSAAKYVISDQKKRIRDFFAG
jgi:hypothetical protein